MTGEQARLSFFEYLQLGADLHRQYGYEPNAKKKLLLSWAIYFASRMACKITEAYLLDSVEHHDPTVRLQANTKLYELWVLQGTQLRGDGTVWN